MVDGLSREFPAGFVQPLEKARHDFARELYRTCMRRAVDGESMGRNVSSTHATWIHLLRGAIQHTSERALTENDWIGVIMRATVDAGIEWMPATWGQKLTSHRVVYLGGAARNRAVILAPAGSLQRAAVEAGQRLAEVGPSQRATRRVIDLGGSVIPFKTIPDRIQAGLEKFVLDQRRTRGTKLTTLNHYQYAMNVLLECLGDYRCDIILIIALTLAASSEMPCVKAERVDADSSRIHSYFDICTPRKDADMFALSVVTRMLWDLKPASFPEGEGHRSMAGKKSMRITLGTDTLSQVHITSSLYLLTIAFAPYNREIQDQYSHA